MTCEAKPRDLIVPSQPNPNFMAGVPELVILRLLNDREMYGYEIVQEIRNSSNNVLSLGEGVIYPVLHALEKGGALKSRRKTVSGRSRVYYAITHKGARRLAELTSHWTTLAVAIQAVLQGVRNAPAV
jgi:PadR family transcriptional regulator, regulatory protein PadR